MKSVSKKRMTLDLIISGVLLVGLVVSLTIILMALPGWGHNPEKFNELLNPGEKSWSADFPVWEAGQAKACSRQTGQTHSRIFCSEYRVAAIGSAYPIPYGAEVCPFSDIPQPALNQLDRDGDGMTDDWELEYGLDKYESVDAGEDLDGDGFSNFEEFQAGTNPASEISHPLYATKLRFVEKKETPFFLVFQGFTEFSDGSRMFQLNSLPDAKSHFVMLGESVENVQVKRFVPPEGMEPPQLYVVRGGHEIRLVRGEVAEDPVAQAELINILDRSQIIATMGALLYLRNDEYTVLGVRPDKVRIKHLETEEVFDIGLADGEQ